MYQFDIRLTDKDYLDYNIFWGIKSPYGSKQILKLRVLLTVVFAIIALLSLSGEGFGAEAFLSIIPAGIVFVIAQLIFVPVFKWVLRGQLNSLKAKGKMGYSPISTIEFGVERFVETTPENKTEQAYTAIERISILKGKVIYIHVNSVMAYIVPFSVFDTKEQETAFLTFLGTKCAVVDLY